MSYPSISVLFNTTPGAPLSTSELARARHLVEHAAFRMIGDAPTEVSTALVSRLHRLLNEEQTEPSAAALGLFVSADHAVAVRLGRPVEERVVIDHTFATRDLVADANRTARFRLLTISERSARLLLGDRHRLVELHDDVWPMQRDDRSVTAWLREVDQQVRLAEAEIHLPMVVAGVERTVRRLGAMAWPLTIGHLAGNHDRTGHAALHGAASTVVDRWLDEQSRRAVHAVHGARSTRRYAGGIEEVWQLANEGRIDTLVVEQGFSPSARVVDGRLELTDQREAPDVVDDVVDETIEAVLRCRGSVVLVDDGDLDDHDRIAAVLRY